MKNLPVEFVYFHHNQFLSKSFTLPQGCQKDRLWMANGNLWYQSFPKQEQTLQQNQHKVMKIQQIANVRSIHKDPTIESHTKYACPFSKTKRFPDRNPICPEAFYSYQSQLSNRKASLGYGQKTDFANLLPITPASNRYRIKSSFESVKGVSFGCARQRSPDRSYLIPQRHRNPGPGQYQNQIQTRMRQTYSLHSKTIDVIEKAKMSNFTPGPGAYQSIDFQSGSKPSLSKYGNSKFGTIDPNMKRFPQIKLTPGPSSYYNDGGILGTGQYTLSRHVGSGGRIFNRQARFTSEQWRPLKTPGPANYLVPTEFGQLQPVNNH